MHWISWLVENRLDSQEGFRYMKYVSKYSIEEKEQIQRKYYIIQHNPLYTSYYINCVFIYGRKE